MYSTMTVSSYEAQLCTGKPLGININKTKQKYIQPVFPHTVCLPSVHILLQKSKRRTTMNIHRKGCEPEVILVTVVILLRVARVGGLPVGEPEESHGRYVRQVEEDMLRRTYDFSTTCPGNIILTLNGRQLNQGNLRLTASDAAALSPALYDQPLEDQIDVWCKVAKMTQELAESIGEQINIFDIDDLKLFQGDILLTRRTVDVAIGNDPTGQGRLQRTLLNSDPDLERLRPQKARVKRKVISDSKFKWENGRVPWRFDDLGKFSESEKQIIREGINSWETKTCLRFPEVSDPGRTPHIRFLKSRGCYSYVGKDPDGQPLSIGDGCAFLGIVAHEIGHAIGFSHEQSRPDRSKYVRIATGNVNRRSLGNFKANRWSQYHTEGVPYDYSSLMHYSVKAFAVDRSRDSVIPLDPEMREAMGQRDDLSFWDVKVANKWYCSDSCENFGPLEWSRCQNDGYRNPNKCTECMCPPGFAPPFCEEVVSNEKCGDNEYRATKTSKLFKSPGFGGAGHPVDTYCAYRFTAPEGMRVKLQFKSLQIQAASTRTPTCRAFVEIRYKHMSLAGPKFCGKRTPSKIIISHGQSAMVIFSTKAEQNKGFELEYSAESCGGCSPSSLSSESACLRTELTECGTGGRRNRCFGVTDNGKRYCCTGYKLSGRNCVASGPILTTTATTKPTEPLTIATTSTRQTTKAPIVPTEPRPRLVGWSSWSGWSKCSRDCGQCGRQYRSRRCFTQSLCEQGSSFETRLCNVRVCPAGTPVGFCDEPRVS